jgi:hypothetical protein
MEYSRVREGGEFDIQPLVSQQPPPAIFISSQLRANATQTIERERARYFAFVGEAVC